MILISKPFLKREIQRLQNKLMNNLKTINSYCQINMTTSGFGNLILLITSMGIYWNRYSISIKVQ